MEMCVGKLMTCSELMPILQEAKRVFIHAPGNPARARYVMVSKDDVISCCRAWVDTQSDHMTRVTCDSEGYVFLA